MRWIFRVLLAVLLFLPLALVVLYTLAVEGSPAVQGSSELDVRDIERARRLLSEHDLRFARPGPRQLRLTEDEVGVLGRYILARYPEVRFRAGFSTGRAILLMSTPVRGARASRYLNIQLTWTATDGSPRLEGLRAGRLQVPGWLAMPLLREGLTRANRWGPLELIGELIEEVRIEPQVLQLRYRWDTDTMGRLRSSLLSDRERAHLAGLQQRLAALSRQTPRFSAIPMTDLLGLLFAAPPGEVDAIMANRLALVALAAYVNRRSLKALTGEAHPKIGHRRVLLRDRRDWAQHFSGSALLAATGGTALADALGLAKEFADSRAGSGFSYTDLAANRAGIRFGELATAGDTAARALQARVATGLREDEIMPAVLDLPEFIPEAEHLRRFGGAEGQAHQALVTEIEKRIEALSLYRRHRASGNSGNDPSDQ